MAFVKIDSAKGPARTVLSAISAVKSLCSQLAALDAHQIVIVKAMLEGMRDPNNDSSPDNYSRLSTELGTFAGEGGDPTADEQSQALYLEIEALYGHMTNDATTLGTLKAQANKVAALVDGN